MGTSWHPDRLCLLVLLLVLGSFPAWSQTTDQEVGQRLESWTQQVLAHNPSLAARRAQRDAEQASLPAASALPSPMIELMVQDMGLPQPREMSMATLGYTQTLPYPGKRSARSDTVQAGLKVRSAQLVELQSQVVRQVRLLFARLYALEKERQSNAKAESWLGLLIQVLEGQVATGQVPLVLILRTQTERDRLLERDLALQAEVERAWAELQALRDEPRAKDEAPITQLVDLGGGVPSEERVLQGNPMLQRLQAAIELARTRTAQARLNTRPDFVVGAGAGLTYGIDPVIIVRLGMELPVFQRESKQPWVHAAEFETVAAEADLREGQAKVRTDWRRWSQTLSQKQAGLKLLRENLRPRAEQVIRLLEGGLAVDRSDIPGWVEAIRLWLDNEVEITRRETDVSIAQANLRALAGDVPVTSERP